MKQNLGKLDRIFRFVLGIWAIQFLLPLIKNETLWWVILIAAVWALLEAMVSLCPANICNKNQ